MPLSNSLLSLLCWEPLPDVRRSYEAINSA